MFTLGCAQFHGCPSPASSMCLPKVAGAQAYQIIAIAAIVERKETIRIGVVLLFIIRAPVREQEKLQASS